MVFVFNLNVFQIVLPQDLEGFVNVLPIGLNYTGLPVLMQELYQKN